MGLIFKIQSIQFVLFFTHLLRKEETPASKKQLGDPVLFTPQCCDTMVTSTPKKGG